MVGIKKILQEHWNSLVEDFTMYYGPMIARNRDECFEIWKSGVELGIELEHRRVLDILKEIEPLVYYKTLDELDKRKGDKK